MRGGELRKEGNMENEEVGVKRNKKEYKRKKREKAPGGFAQWLEHWVQFQSRART